MQRVDAWDSKAEYEVGAVVMYAGRIWQASAPSRGVAPAGGGPWLRIDTPPAVALGNTRGNPHVTEVGP